jgi:hypothetical protein
MIIIAHAPDLRSGNALSPVSPDRLVTGAPEQAFDVLHTSADGNFATGLYVCTIGAWRVHYNEDEFCTLIDGHVRLTAEDGTVQEFKAPASFTIPSGYQGTWEAVTPVKKFFAIYEKQR